MAPLPSSMFDALPDAVVVVREDATIAATNADADELFAWPPGTLVGQPASVLIPADAGGTDIAGWIARLQDAHALPDGRRELIGLRRDASCFPMEVGVREVLFEEQRHFVCLLRDLSAQRRREWERAMSLKHDAIGRLASGVAHDFNNLLMGIMGCANLALDRLSEHEPAHAFVARIQAAARQGAALPAQLIALHRTTSRETVLVDVRRTLEEVFRLAAHMSDARHERVLTIDAEGLWVHLGAGQLEQALTHLIANAHDAMSEGGTLELRAQRRVLSSTEAVLFDLPRGEYVVIEVIDDGCGLHEQARTHAFEPFFTTKDVGQGAGLGLATVYATVRAGGGHVSLEPALPRGTRARILLPACAPPRPVAMPIRSDAPLVLLVDDDDLVRLALRAFLERAGLRVVEAAGGAAALRLAEGEARVDVLLCDVGLPDGSGFGVADQIRARHPALTLFLMSGYGREHAARLGARPHHADVAWLEKPFEEATLLEALRGAGVPLHVPTGDIAASE